MPHADFLCGVCGQVLLDVMFPMAVGATASAPEHCGRRTTWIPSIGAMDAFEPGQEFTVRDGQNRLVKVESFAQMHKLEAESAAQAANGEGQPIRFRMLHQHRNNREVNTFGEAPFEKPTSEALRKFTPKPLTEDRGYGPGVGDHNTSALKGD